MNNHAIPGWRIVRKYQLGVVTEPLRGDEAFAGMLAIPYLTKHGVRSIKFRNLRDSGPKNLYHEGQKHRLYNTSAYFDADDVIGIAEGEPDAICATERLEIPAVGVPGVEAWKANHRIWAPIFKNFRKVLVFTDGDPVNKNTGLRPGEEMGKAIRESLGWRSRIVASPEGFDVCSMVYAGREKELVNQFGDEDDTEDDLINAEMNRLEREIDNR